jgi:hypothetical protein
VTAQAVHDSRMEAHPSVAPRARSNERTESGPAQIDAVAASLRRLGIIGAQGAL